MVQWANQQSKETPNGWEDQKAIKYKITVIDEDFTEAIRKKIDISKINVSKYMRDDLAPATDMRDDLARDYPYMEKLLSENGRRGTSHWHRPSWIFESKWLNYDTPWNPFRVLDYTFFKIKSLYLQNNRYVIQNQDNSYFHSDIIKLNQWIIAKNFFLGLPPTESKGEELINWFFIREDYNSIKVLNAKGDVKTTIPGDMMTILEREKWKILVINKNRFEVTTINSDWSYTQERPIMHPYGKIEKISIDNNENFIFLVVSDDSNKKLCILNRKTLELIDEIPDISEIVSIDNKNNISAINWENKYLSIDTNLDQFPKWFVDSWKVIAESEIEVVSIQDKPRSELKNILSSGWIVLTHEMEEVLDESENGSQTNDTQLREQIWQSPIAGFDNKTLRNLYLEAHTSQEIDAVYAISQQLKKNPHITAVKWLVEPIVWKITNKRDEIKLSEMSAKLIEIQQELPTIKDFADMVSLKNKLQEIKQSRSQIIAINKDVDLLLKETLGVINDKITEFQMEHKEQMDEDIKKNIGYIHAYMDWIDFLPQITSVYTTDLRKQTEQMLQYLSDEDRKKFKKQMADTVMSRQNVLTKKSKDSEKSLLQQQEAWVTEIKTKISSLKWILDSIQDEDALKSLEISDPLVLMIREEINDLPENKAQELNQRLEQLFKERTLSIQFTKDAAKGTLKSLDQYGIPKSLYFVPEVTKKVKWDISAKPWKDGQYRLTFVSSTWNVIEPSINKKILWNFKFTYTFAERQKLKKDLGERRSNGVKSKYKTLRKNHAANPNDEQSRKELEELANKYYVPRMVDIMNTISWEGNRWNLTPRKNLPSIDSRTVITSTIQDSLSERWDILGQQLQYKQGIMIVESEAGTGKNFKCDILGHLTNRELFDVSCNEYMEKEDLLFSPEIDNDGTHRKPSQLVQGLRTPWAIIVLDEINTLKPWVSKLLNPLLDGRRYINDPQMGRVHAHPSVIIVGLMNPTYYRGTKELPQEFKSRAMMTNDKYPEPQEEAYMISRFLDGGLSKLTQDEFNHYRDEYVVRNQRPVDRAVYDIFAALHAVVKVAKKLREVYSKTMSGDANSGEELNFIFTSRDGNYVVQNFNSSKNIKKSIKNVVIPKVSDLEQKKFAASLIDSLV